MKRLESFLEIVDSTTSFLFPTREAKEVLFTKKYPKAGASMGCSRFERFRVSVGLELDLGSNSCFWHIQLEKFALGKPK